MINSAYYFCKQNLSVSYSSIHKTANELLCKTTSPQLLNHTNKLCITFPKALEMDITPIFTLCNIAILINISHHLFTIILFRLAAIKHKFQNMSEFHLHNSILMFWISVSRSRISSLSIEFLSLLSCVFSM